MSSALSQNEYGYKRLSPENWRTVDPAWSGVVMSDSRPDPSALLLAVMIFEVSFIRV